MTTPRTLGLAALLVLALVTGGCATKKYLKAEVSASEGRVKEDVGKQIGQLETQIEANQTKLREHDRSIADATNAAGEASKTAKEALERALAAGKLGEGKLLYETVLSNDQVKFGFEKAELGDDARSALDQFADQLKQQNQSVYIEIQGHTDASGEDAYNLALGQQRAEAALRHLSQAGIPLHRMSVISYGESEPVADNASRDGRAKNRRVVLVVLQ